MSRLIILSATIVLVLNPISTSAIAYCSAPIEGPFESNLISAIDNVSDEETCDRLCQDEQICGVYTYYPAGSPTYSETCYLLTALGEPIRECEDNSCVSGLPNCEGNICAFIEGGVMYPEGRVVTEEEKNIELLLLGACPSPVAIAIGAGGPAFNGGAGSGEVDFTTSLPQGAYIKMRAHPGGRNVGDSYLREVADDMYIVRGRRGEGADSKFPGAGYSGGGGFGNSGGGRGGSNGTDGEYGIGDAPLSNDGGAGSGVQINNIQLSNIVLSPGEGGTAGSSAGGGGGGVLINGQGPARPSSYCGEGYGGGAGGLGEGLAGAIILDFAPDE